MKVESFLRLHYVKGGFAPALIHKNIRKSIFGSEIYIVFIGLGIYPGFEVHAIDIEHSPPLPAYFSGLEPRIVSRHFRRRELPSKRIFQ